MAVHTDTSAPPVSLPLPGLLLLLSMATGLVDAASVLGLGKVFTANMTGNIVFLGFAVAGTPTFTVAPYLVALTAFVFGGLAAGRTGQVFRPRPLRQWLLVAAVVETSLLWLAALVAGMSGRAQLADPPLFAIIALTALAMGFRNATIRQLKVPDLTTTVLTLTIAGIAADSHLAGGASPNLARRLAAVLAIFVGATVGAVLVMRAGLAPPLGLAGFLVLTGTAVWAWHPSAAVPPAA